MILNLSQELAAPSKQTCPIPGMFPGAGGAGWGGEYYHTSRIYPGLPEVGLRKPREVP